MCVLISFKYELYEVFYTEIFQIYGIKVCCALNNMCKSIALIHCINAHDILIKINCNNNAISCTYM